MDTVPLNRKMVLKATFLNHKPAEAIRNRLGSGRPKVISRFDLVELKTVLEQLIDFGLVETKKEGDVILYRKVPNAMPKLAQIEKNIDLTSTN